MTDSVTARMEQWITTWQATGDRRAIFLQCYQMMTENVLVGVANGRFHNGDWVTQLLHNFADYYFDALAHYEQQQPCAAVWQQTHDAACQQEANVLQHLFLGVNAHINYDLVLSLYDVLRPEWAALDEATRQQYYADHCLVNELIAETIDAVQDEVVERHSPLMALIDWLGGPLDEFIIAELISHWRKDVWDTAVLMLETPSADAREALRQQLQTRVLRRGQQILGQH